MNIRTSVRITKVNQQANSEMQNLLTNKDHIAWTEYIDKEISFEGQKHKSKLIDSPYLRTFSLDRLNHIESNRRIRKEYITLGKVGCDLAQQCFPELVDRPVDGIKLFDSLDKLLIIGQYYFAVATLRRQQKVRIVSIGIHSDHQ